MIPRLFLYYHKITKNFYPSFIAFMTSQYKFIIKNICYRKPLWILEVAQHRMEWEGWKERFLYKNFAAMFVICVTDVSDYGGPALLASLQLSKLLYK